MFLDQIVLFQAHGLEARTPFLDRCFVQNYLSIPHNIRYHPGKNQCEKYLLRKAFEEMNVIPKEVLLELKKLSQMVLANNLVHGMKSFKNILLILKVKDTLVFLRMKLKNYTIKMFLTDTFQTTDTLFLTFGCLNLLKQKTQVLEHLNYMPIR